MSKLRLGYSGSSFLSPVFLAVILALVTPVAAAQSSSVFNGPRDYPVGSSPTSVVIGDFNGDGRPDIATANSVSNDVSVLLQNSDGTFQTAVSYPVGNSPTSLQVGDVNGDGKLDLVLINSTDNTLAVLLGNGDGTFQPQQLTMLPDNPQPMIVGDFNGDGKTDVALAEPLPQVGKYAVAVLLSNGNGTFQAAVTYPVNASPSALAVGDFNNDGKLDIVSTVDANGAGVSVLLGNGDGTFQEAVNSATSATPQSPPLLVADFNHDGNLDVVATTVAADTGANVTLFLGNGDGTFQVEVISLPSLDSSGKPVAAGDLNGDGKPDLVVSEGGSQIILLNNGDGTFTEGPSLTLVSQSLALFDLNGDHEIDLVAGVATLGGAGIVSVLHGNGDGSFAQFPSYAVNAMGLFNSLVAPDFNSDGKPDLGVTFLAPPDEFHIAPLQFGLFLNNGAGFSPPILSEAQPQAGAGIEGAEIAYGAAADFNGDGKMDVAATSNLLGGISILLGKGDGTFQSAVQYGGTSNLMGPIAVGDFNNDGKLDIVSTPDISVLPGNGDGTFGFPVSFPTGGEVLALATGDFNHDGKLDVAAVEFVSGETQLEILLGNGDDTFSSGATYNLGINAIAIASGDLNGDGIADVIVGDYNASFLVVLLGNGDGTFQTPITTNIGDGGLLPLQSQTSTLTEKLMRCLVITIGAMFLCCWGTEMALCNLRSNSSWVPLFLL